MYASLFPYPLMSNLVMKYTSFFIEVCVTAYFNGVTRSILTFRALWKKVSMILYNSNLAPCDQYSFSMKHHSSYISSVSVTNFKSIIRRLDFCIVYILIQYLDLLFAVWIVQYELRSGAVERSKSFLKTVKSVKLFIGDFNQVYSRLKVWRSNLLVLSYKSLLDHENKVTDTLCRLS